MAPPPEGLTVSCAFRDQPRRRAPLTLTMKQLDPPNPRTPVVWQRWKLPSDAIGPSQISAAPWRPPRLTSGVRRSSQGDPAGHQTTDRHCNKCFHNLHLFPAVPVRLTGTSPPAARAALLARLCVRDRLGIVISPTCVDAMILSVLAPESLPTSGIAGDGPSARLGPVGDRQEILMDMIAATEFLARSTTLTSVGWIGYIIIGAHRRMDRRQARQGRRLRHPDEHRRRHHRRADRWIPAQLLLGHRRRRLVVHAVHRGPRIGDPPVARRPGAEKEIAARWGGDHHPDHERVAGPSARADGHQAAGARARSRCRVLHPVNFSSRSGHVACAAPTFTSPRATCRYTDRGVIPGHEVVGEVDRNRARDR